MSVVMTCESGYGCQIVQVASRLLTSGETRTDSSCAMCSIRERVAPSSSGVKRNLEQRDASGSMILPTFGQCGSGARGGEMCLVT